MQPRIDYVKFAPEAQRAMYGLEKYLPRAASNTSCSTC